MRAPNCLGFERGAGCRHDAFELEQAIDRRLFAYDDQIDSACPGRMCAFFVSSAILLACAY